MLPGVHTIVNAARTSACATVLQQLLSSNRWDTTFAPANDYAQNGMRRGKLLVCLAVRTAPFAL